MAQHRGWFYLALTVLPWLGLFAIFHLALHGAG